MYILKKKKIVSCFCLFVSIILLACTNNTTSKKNEDVQVLPTIKISPPDVNKLPFLHLSELAYNVEYFKLETRKDLLLGHCQVYYSDTSNYMLVVSDNKLRIFDKNGKYIRKIGEIGRGPNEFIPRQVAVDFSNDILYIYTLWERHILKFDFNGNFKGVIENELFADLSILKYMDGQLILVNAIGPHLKEAFKGGYMELSSFDPNSNKINYYLPNNWDIKYNRNMLSFTVNDNELLSVVNNKIAYYKMQYCDTLYKVANGKIKPFLFIDMGNHKYSVERCQIRQGEPIAEHFKNKILIQSMFASNNKILLQCTYFNPHIKQDNESFLCVFNRYSNEYTYYNSNIINDINGGPNVSVKDLSSPSYLRLAPVLFKDQPDGNTNVYFSRHDNTVLKFPERKNEFNNMINSSKIDDNPIVQIITLRDNY